MKTVERTNQGRDETAKEIASSGMSDLVAYDKRTLRVIKPTEGGCRQDDRRLQNADEERASLAFRFEHKRRTCQSERSAHSRQKIEQLSIVGQSATVPEPSCIAGRDENESHLPSDGEDPSDKG